MSFQEPCCIKASSTVELHLDIRLKDGSIAESTRQIGKPMTFEMGTSVFSDTFERALLGLRVGDKKKIMLLPQEAFGLPHPANIFQFPCAKFSHLDDPLELGLIVMFEQPNGQAHPGIIQGMTETEVTVDFNHPLAGQVLLFEVEVVGVLPSPSLTLL